MKELCECCGKEIKRDFGKVCEKCERKVLNNLKNRGGEILENKKCKVCGGSYDGEREMCLACLNELGVNVDNELGYTDKVYGVKRELEYEKEAIIMEIGEFEIVGEKQDKVMIEAFDIEYECWINEATNRLQIKEVGYEGLF